MLRNVSNCGYHSFNSRNSNSCRLRARRSHRPGRAPAKAEGGAKKRHKGNRQAVLTPAKAVIVKPGRRPASLAAFERLIGGFMASCIQK